MTCPHLNCTPLSPCVVGLSILKNLLGPAEVPTERGACVLCRSTAGGSGPVPYQLLSNTEAHLLLLFELTLRIMEWPDRMTTDCVCGGGGRCLLAQMVFAASLSLSEQIIDVQHSALIVGNFSSAALHYSELFMTLCYIAVTSTAVLSPAHSASGPSAWRGLWRCRGHGVAPSITLLLLIVALSSVDDRPC